MARFKVAFRSKGASPGKRLTKIGANIVGQLVINWYTGKSYHLVFVITFMLA